MTFALDARTAPRHPPSDGAHRLAWWLAAADGRVRALSVGAQVSAMTIERWLTGDVEPDEAVAAAIARETEGAVLPEDWRRGGPLGWREPPFRREA